MAHGDGCNACDRSHAEDYRVVTWCASEVGCLGEAHNTGGDVECENTEAACWTTVSADECWLSVGGVICEGSTIYAKDCLGYDCCHVTDVLKT